MRNPPLVLAALLALGVVLVFVLFFSVQHRLPATAPSFPTSAAVPEAPAEIPIEPAAAAKESARSLAPQETPAASASTPETRREPRAHVFGRLIDEEGHAVADAGVSLYPVGGRWAEGVTVPTKKSGDHEYDCFTATTGDDGRFTFDAPVPSADWVSLGVDVGPYLGLAGRSFGPAGGRNQPRLVEGDNDLGEVALAITGAIAGRVLDEGGAPIAKAGVRLEGIYPGGLGVFTSAGDDGSYALGHVPPGTVPVSVGAPGYLSAKVDGIEVVLRRTTNAPAFHLKRAPTIAGVVVDERGAPLEGVRVWGWPVGSGQGAGAKTGADGRFTIALPQDEPYDLGVKRDPRFEDWGGHSQPGSRFDPGRDDVRIVLKRAARTTFAVVDAATGAPIERFGIQALPATQHGAYAGNAFQEMRLETHAGGTVELSAAPEQHVVGVIAPEHAPFEGPVVHDAGAASRVTLRLAAGAAVSGRVVHAGAPLARASVRFERDRVKIDPKLPDTDDLFDENATFDVGGLAGRKQMLSADAGGAFRVDGLAPGTYRLTVWGGRAARRTLRGLRVEAGGTLALGDVPLESGATIQGRLVLGQGLSPVGVEVQIDDDWDRELSIGSADGRFAFENLEPGKHSVQVRRAPPAILEDIVREIELPAGGTRELVIDLAGQAPARVVVRVSRGGKPVAGIELCWKRSDAQIVSTLGRTDAEGLLRASCESGRIGRVVAVTGTRHELGASAEITLAPGLDQEIALTIHTGRLTVVLPASLAIPEAGSVGVRLQVADENDPWRGWLQAATAGSPFAPPGGQVWKEHRVDLGEVAAGEYTALVGVHRSARDAARENSWTSLPILPDFETKIVVREGETTVVEFPAPR